MLYNIPREYAQAASVGSMMLGIALMTVGPVGVQIGAIFGLFSLWVLLISESLLLTKVQNEMQTVLEVVRKKQEADIQDLLYFLQQSQVSAEPRKTIEGSKKLCKRFPFPAMVLTPDHQIVEVNKLMCALLRREHKDLIEKGAHTINHQVLMSKIGELCSEKPYIDNESMHTRYAYMQKNNVVVTGTMTATEIEGKVGFFVNFYPDKENVINDEQLRMIIYG